MSYLSGEFRVRRPHAEDEPARAKGWVAPGPAQRRVSYEGRPYSERMSTNPRGADGGCLALERGPVACPGKCDNGGNLRAAHGPFERWHESTRDVRLTCKAHQGTAVGVPERACVEQAVEEERPERVVGCKQDEVANLPAPGQATGGPLEPEFLEATEGQVGDDVELDPAVVRMIVGDEEGMRSAAVTREATVGERRKSLLEPQEVRR